MNKSQNSEQKNMQKLLKELDDSDWSIIDGYGLKPTDNIAYIPMYWYKPE